MKQIDALYEFIDAKIKYTVDPETQDWIIVKRLVGRAIEEQKNKEHTPVEVYGNRACDCCGKTGRIWRYGENVFCEDCLDKILNNK